MGDLAPDGTPYSPEERERFERSLSRLTADIYENPPRRIDPYAIAGWHRFVAEGIPKMLPGTFRTSQRVRMGDNPGRPTTAPEKVQEEIELLFRRLQNTLDQLDKHLEGIGDFDKEALNFLVVTACQFHAGLVGIHPFMDGNGRISRLALGWLFVRYGFNPPEYRDRSEYIDALNRWHDARDIKPLADLTLRELNRLADETD